MNHYLIIKNGSSSKENLTYLTDYSSFTVSLESPKRSLEESSINFGIALLFFACYDFCPQSVNRAKNQNSGQNLKTATVSFGIFEAVFGGFFGNLRISASKTSTNKPSHI